MDSILKSIIILISIANHLPHTLCDPNGPIVSTKLGKIVGTVRTLEEGQTSVNLFNGIRYGEPPVGDLRFRPTVPVTKPWNDTYEAIKNRYECPQSDG